MKEFDVVAFDADDTLWHSEDGFRAAEQRFCSLLAPYASEGVDVAQALTAMERANLALYGYGVKAFGLSMMEAALSIGQDRLPNSVFAEIIDVTRDLLLAPVRLLPNAARVLERISDSYKVVLITKGDLIHQSRKVRTSGLDHHFHHIEIVLEKDRETYRRIMRQLDVDADRFCMIGNSIRSDVQPVLDEGAHAIHVPYEYLWELEKVDVLPSGPRFAELSSLNDLPEWLGLGAH